ncbi:MAG: hypothetical protein J6J26_03840 [Bacteroides sp.]|nr:hypothetical protein [Bacteroides sp.]
MYKGNEKLILHGEELPYSMLDFWQWAYSSILLNMNRGTFAEFIIKCALQSHGFNPDVPEKTGMEPFDVTGPTIPSLNRYSRIEVKSAAYIQVWSDKPSDKATFGIAPAILPNESGDYQLSSPKQRNNDLYVFCIYTAKSKDCNILDLQWWEFYVYPTYKIDEDTVLSKQKTISLAKIRKLGIQPCGFDNLYDAIQQAIADISAHHTEKSRP